MRLDLTSDEMGLALLFDGTTRFSQAQRAMAARTGNAVPIRTVEGLSDWLQNMRLTAPGRLDEVGLKQVLQGA
jgi:hypothetical protein